MIAETIDNTGAVPKEVSADTVYYLPRSSRISTIWGWTLSSRRIRLTTAGHCRQPSRTHSQTALGERPDAAEAADQTWPPTLCATHADRGADLRPYKQGRGFRQFPLSGLEKVNGDWSLICTTHNLLKLFRYGLSTATLLNSSWLILRRAASETPSCENVHFRHPSLPTCPVPLPRQMPALTRPPQTVGL